MQQELTEMRTAVRTFETGAIRDLDEHKLDYEGFLSPLVLERYAEYLHHHRQTAAGLRYSDNWQRGIPLNVYMKSMFRHFMDVWQMHRGWRKGMMQEALCAVLFNAMGYLHELLAAQHRKEQEEAAEMELQRMAASLAAAVPAEEREALMHELRDGY